MRYFAASFTGGLGALALVAIPDDRVAWPLFIVLFIVAPLVLMITDKNFGRSSND